MTPLHEAAAKDSDQVAGLLLKVGENQGLQLLEVTDKYGITPLLETILKDSLKVAEILIKAGSNQLVTDHHGRTLLDVAAWNKSVKVTELLKIEAAKKAEV